jgi:hypothetical protein
VTATAQGCVRTVEQPRAGDADGWEKGLQHARSVATNARALRR